MNEGNKDTRGPFGARLGLALRELDGLERAPDVSANVARSLHEPIQARSRPRLHWSGVAAAVFVAAVTAVLFAQRYVDRGDGGSESAVAAQDPAGPWRLVYELPVDELQRSLRGDSREDLEQLLTRSVDNLRLRLATIGKVTRSDATTFTVDLADSSRDLVARVRGIIENVGRFEMRMLADADYSDPAVTFAMDREVKQLEGWLDAGGRERLQSDPAAIRDYQAISKDLRWYPRRLQPDPLRPSRWQVRYADLNLDVVAAHAEADWNNSVVPQHIRAKPEAERFLVELFPINLHAEHFTGADLDPASLTVITGRKGGLEADLGYSFRDEKVAEYSDFSERWLNKHCAMLWNGEVLSAPRFISRIPGSGRLINLAPQLAEVMVAAMRAELPARPVLLRSAAHRPK